MATTRVGKCAGRVMDPDEDGFTTLCPCAEGSFTPVDGISWEDIRCAHCPHKITAHAPSRHSLETRSPPSLDPAIIPRKDTCKQILDLLKARSVVHVRGTPTSGKSTLAHLLASYIRSSETESSMTAVYLNAESLCDLSKGKGVGKIVKSVNAWLDDSLQGIEGHWQNNPNLVIMIDEGHITYQDGEFWHSLKDFYSYGRQTNFLILCAWGSPTKHVVPLMGTSMTLTNTQRIGFRPLDHRRDSVDREDGGLFFTEEEFNNAAASYMDYRSQDVKFRIDDSALEYIKGLSCGHPGVSGATFQILWSYWHDKSRWGSRHLPITCAEARNIFEDRVRVSKEFTDLTPVNRGFFKLEDVTADVEKEFEGEDAVSKIKDFLRKIIHKGSFSLSEANETEESLMRILYHRGIVQAELAPKSNDEVEEVIYVFPTLLHQRHYEYLTSEELYPLDKSQVSSLEDLLKQCLTNFKSQALTNSRRHQDLLGPAGVRRPIEAIYQSELYRTLDKVLKGAYAQSDWCGPGHSQGRIDFRVIIPRPDNEATEFYGIECVRDGDRMRSHVDRFLEKGSQEDTEEGAYYQWTKDGSLTAFAFVDFTTNENDPLRRDCSSAELSMDILRGLLLGLQFFLAKGPQRLAPLSWLSAEQQMIKSVMPKLDAQAEREYHDG